MFSDIRLYIILRNDMASLTGTPSNPITGKACAQAAHAANFCIKNIKSEEHIAYLREWENQANGYGTTIVLGASLGVISEVVRLAAMANFPAGIVVDPTYPLTDGRTMHFLSVETCGYVFGPKAELEPFLVGIELLP